MPRGEQAPARLSAGNSAGSRRDLYRPEIDGLRAVAVVAVLLFHAGVPGFAGGFVGVDLFFVVSGYLITRLILDELEDDRFRFARFYARRARRLFPALFATLVATFAGALVLLYPEDLVDTSLATLAALASLSNLYFWGQAGYFDAAATSKPLLHTWSLGVEEQFYLVWPLALVLAYRWRRRSGALAMLVAAFVLSLAASEWAAGRAPDAAFYGTPFRIFELALGGLCLWGESAISRLRLGREGLAVGGLALVALGIATQSPEARFPGFAALLPCGGAALFLLAGDARLSTQLLANRLAVGLGRISYSLYLVHWPLLVLAGYGRSAPLEMRTKLALLALSVGLAAASYRFVELPFRRRGAGRSGSEGGLSDPAWGLAVAGFAAALAIPAVVTVARHGWPERLPRDIREQLLELPAMKRRHFADANALGGMPFPVAGRENVVVVGDSHAADLLSALRRSGSSAALQFLNVSQHCQPVLGPRPYGPGTRIRTHEEAAECERQGERLRTDPRLAAADTIVFASAWLDYGLARLPETLTDLRRRYRARILLVGGRFSFAEPGQIFRWAEDADAASARFDAAKSLLATRREVAALEEAAAHAGVQLLDLRPFTCSAPRKGWRCPLFDESGDLLYWDSNHWTATGARRVGEALRASETVPYLFGVAGPQADGVRAAPQPAEPRPGSVRRQKLPRRPRR